MNSQNKRKRYHQHLVFLLAKAVIVTEELLGAGVQLAMEAVIRPEAMATKMVTAK